MTASALTIAGSDPGGGAGIQADLRVFHSLGIAGLSAISAITSQNSHGVRSMHPVDAVVLASQLQALFEDFRPSAVKIGMLGGADQARAVAAALRRYEPRNIVLDPVLASSGGVPLLDDAGRHALLDELLPLCDLVTPNLDEARILAGMECGDSLEEIEALGRSLIAQGARKVLVKGGHRAGNLIDLLVVPQSPAVPFPRERVDTGDTHGTGCFLSSAIAACLGHGLPLSRAIRFAGEMLISCLQTPTVTGGGPGYPDLPRVWPPINTLHYTSLVARLRGLYVITDADLPPKRSHLEIAQAAIEGGAGIIQLRDKSLPTPDLVRIGRQMQKLAEDAHALFIVNDRVDVALACQAHGVHVGPNDMRPDDVRRVLTDRMLLGVSVGTVEEARRWAGYASYFGVGSIYGTVTKADAGAPVGPARITEIKAAVPHRPIAAIGGIDASNIAEVTFAGAEAAAVVSAVVSADDMIDAVRQLVRLRDSAARPPEDVEPLEFPVFLL